MKNGQVSSTVAAAKIGQVSSTFAAARNCQVSSTFAAVKNGQVSSTFTAAKTIFKTLYDPISSVKLAVHLLQRKMVK